MSWAAILLLIWAFPIVPLMLLARSLISTLNPRRNGLALGVAAAWPLWLVLGAAFLIADLVELILRPLTRRRGSRGT